MHIIASLEVKDELEEYKEEIVRNRISKRRRKVTLHDPIIIVNQSRITVKLIMKSRRIGHDMSKMAKEDGIQGTWSIVKMKQRIDLEPKRN